MSVSSILYNVAIAITETEKINGNIGDMRFVQLEITVADPE